MAKRKEISPTIDTRTITKRNRFEILAELEDLEIGTLSENKMATGQRKDWGAPKSRAESLESAKERWTSPTNMILVETRTWNGRRMNRNATPREAKEIFKSLQLVAKEQIDMAGFSFDRGFYPIVQYKLKCDVVVPNLFSGPEFEAITRTSIPGKNDKFDCRILGVRYPKQAEMEGTSRVTLYGANFTNKEIVTEWLEKFGTLESDYEDLYYPKDDPTDSSEEQYLNGNIRVLMTIKKEIPQFLPINGFKVRIQYQGVQQICNNCFSVGHIWSDCPNSKVSFIDHAQEIAEALDCTENMLGRWCESFRRRNFNKKREEHFEEQDEPTVDGRERDKGNQLQIQGSGENQEKRTESDSDSSITGGTIRTGISKFTLGSVSSSILGDKEKYDKHCADTREKKLREMKLKKEEKAKKGRVNEEKKNTQQDDMDVLEEEHEVTAEKHKPTGGNKGRGGRGSRGGGGVK